MSVIMSNLTRVLSTLIAANHILHYQDVLDAFGHISVRNPNNASTFFLSRDLAPALVSSRGDLVEYLVADASPVNQDAPRGYIERFIHSETLKRYPSVNSVVHSHADAVIPFGVTQEPLRAVIQVGSFLGSSVRVFDTANHNPPAESQTLLVRNAALGAAMASYFSNDTGANSTEPANNVVLMRGHGMAVIGPDIIIAVYRAVNARVNAESQQRAMVLADLGQNGAGGVRYLSERERLDTEAFGTIYSRPWELWVREVEAAARGRIYRNELGSPPT